jgi:undecaprenyl-diphosphatase
MTNLDAVILGLVQGLTEFLPVSSSGHLVIGQHLLKFEGPNLAFDIVLHLGTLLAVVVYFWRDIRKILASFMGKGNGPWRRVGLLVLAGTVPTGLIGVLFKDPLTNMFGSVRIVAMMLTVTGILLFMADRVTRTNRSLADIRAWDALVIGVVQGLAIIPGISRSGSTIATGLFLKIEPDAAARFSFLLSIPAILGAVALEGKDIFGQAVDGSATAFAAGFVTAAVSGWLAIIILLRMLKWKRLTIFSVYCWSIAAATLLFIL